MTENNLFDIQNLICGYKSKPRVLKIDRLRIERAKIYFIIGPSGIGKSTFIEALGLMNDTINIKDSEKLDYYKKNGEKISLIKNWYKGNNDIHNFRKENFSFLFQNNYLMPNFTAGENIMFTAMLKNGDFYSNQGKVVNLMKSVGLNMELFDRKVSNLSGGQKQRIAFVRSLNVANEVLFADEPTGNLDPKTARIMMEVLKDEIINKNASALIVSHDIALANEFADVIVQIYSQKENDDIIGLITEDQIYYKDNNAWYLNNNKVIGNISTTLLNSF